MTTMAEPEWDQETRDFALGLDGVDLCPACGGPAFLCQDSANEFRWTVPAPVRCHRKTALEEARSRITEETNPVPGALLWRVVLDQAGGGAGA